MPWEAWFTAAVIVLMVGLLVLGRWSADVIVVGCLLLLTLFGVISPLQAAAGFGSTAVLTVAMLYVVATGLQQTGAMGMIAEAVLGRPKSELGAQARLVLPVTAMSAFVNNTPIVAMFIPCLSSLSRRASLNAGRLFMPLSFASILGGVCTLIGTSTTVLVAGLFNDYSASRDLSERFSMFTITPIGIPVAIAGVGFMLLFGRRLLPVRRTPHEQAEGGREFLAAMRVPAGSPLIGKSVEKAGLRHLPSLFLSRIDREPKPVLAVAPEEVLRSSDVLVFVGDVTAINDLRQMKGLEPTGTKRGYRPNMRLIEAVVSANSRFRGRTIRASRFRTITGAVVVAVHRQGHRLQGRIGDIRLQTGDTILLEAPPGFVRRHQDSDDFYLAYERQGDTVPRHDRAWLAIGVLLLLVILLSSGVVAPMVAAMLAAGLMVGLRCCTGAQARSGVQLNVLVVIAAAFGIGEAMKVHGLAQTIADFFVATASPLGPYALLATIYALTTLFTMTMTNNAAAVLMFPIAVGVAEAAGLNPLVFAIAIAVSASCEFSTPIGYQTNLMVMGPGGYKWLDYTRFGLPLTLLCAVVAVALTPLMLGWNN